MHADNLYLDMNGIIHRCSHPDENSAKNVLLEEKIFLNIFEYIGRLFNVVKPRRVFYMAVDGAARQLCFFVVVVLAVVCSVCARRQRVVVVVSFFGPLQVWRRAQK